MAAAPRELRPNNKPISEEPPSPFDIACSERLQRESKVFFFKPLSQPKYYIALCAATTLQT